MPGPATIAFVRGLSRRLLAGAPRLNVDLSVSILDPAGEQIDSIAPNELEPSDYGYVYERLVGLEYEARGFAVQYRMQFGFSDSGVDLVCEKGNELRFVQCKCTRSSISRGRVEQLLYAASAFVARHRGQGRQLFFDLVVPSLDQSFPARVTKRSKRTVPNVALASFERYNLAQREVRLEVVELLPHFQAALRTQRVTGLGAGMPSPAGDCQTAVQARLGSTSPSPPGSGTSKRRFSGEPNG